MAAATSFFGHQRALQTRYQTTSTRPHPPVIGAIPITQLEVAAGAIPIIQLEIIAGAIQPTLEAAAIPQGVGESPPREITSLPTKMELVVTAECLVKSAYHYRILNSNRSFTSRSHLHHKRLLRQSLIPFHVYSFIYMLPLFLSKLIPFVLLRFLHCLMLKSCTLGEANGNSLDENKKVNIFSE